jgi:transcription-repair coupling factor (superfamily II helicase)
MKDLEIRGAGNILGPQQSGHIAAVGYDMYCRLLKVTIERVRAGQPGETLASDAEVAPGVELELGLRAFLPESWIPSQDTRLEVLRSLDLIHAAEEADAALATLRDRFGRVPEEALTLVRTFRLRARLLELGIRRLAWHREAYLVEYEDRLALEPLLGGGRSVELRHLRDGVAHLMIPRKQDTPLRALTWLEGLLAAPLEPVPTGGERP